MRRLALSGGVVVLVGVAVLVGFLIGARTPQSTDSSGSANTQPAPSATPKSAAASDEPIEVSLTGDAIARAGIKTAVVRSEAASTSISLPGP